MKNISFDNPYLLLVMIPIAIVVVVSYFIAASKDNKTLAWKISVVLHLAIGALVSLALAGIMSVSVLTQTTVYVVADVSYSSQRNFDEIDQYIAGVKKALPSNSKLGVVCFGKNTVILASPGRTIKSVSTVNVDDSGTDIAKALNYTGGLFKGDTIKRIVLITDGNDTVNKQTGTIAAAVENLTSAGVKLDTIFLNNALQEGDAEVQLSDVTFTESLYLNHENTAKFLVQSSVGTEVSVTLYGRAYGETEYEEIDERPATVESGFNTIAMNLPNDEGGVYEYKAVLTAENDFSPNNNEICFTQTVEGKIRVLHLTGNNTDKDFVKATYGDEAIVESFLVTGNGSFTWESQELKTIKCTGEINGENCGHVYSFSQEDYYAYINEKNATKKEAARKKIACPNEYADKKCDATPIIKVPFSLEDLAYYDEIVISNLDVRNIKNANTLLYNLDIVISQQGKGLITFGNLYLHTDKEDAVLSKLADLVPVIYGEANEGGRLYTIAIDVSSSMNNASKMFNAKEAAIQLLSVLGESDEVCLITFSGAVYATQPKPLTKEYKQTLIDQINKIKPDGGTDINGGIHRALEEIIARGLAENNVMIISDGLSVGNDDLRNSYLQQIRDRGGVVSCINTYSSAANGDPTGEGRALLQDVARRGGGKCYVITNQNQISSVIFGNVAQEVTEAIVERESPVVIENYDEEIANGFSSFPSVSTFIQSREKSDAEVPVQVYYEKAWDGKVPLYAYRAHGNGRVSSWMTSLGAWTKNWEDEKYARFFKNMLIDNKPTQKVDYPFSLKVETNDFETRVEMTPSDPQVYEKVTLQITDPNGKTSAPITMVKNLGVYSYSFDSLMIGTYKLTVVYHYSYERSEGEDQHGAEYEEVHVAEWYINRSYLPEYDAYESFDSAKIYDFMRGNGTINLGTIPNLKHNKSEITTYMVSYRIPLLIVSIILFLIDIFIRKLRFKDKRFKKAEKEKAEKQKLSKQEKGGTVA